MGTHSEPRGQYLIVASACRLEREDKYQPRLTVPRLETVDGLPRSQSFPGLNPLVRDPRCSAALGDRSGPQPGRRMLATLQDLIRTMPIAVSRFSRP